MYLTIGETFDKTHLAEPIVQVASENAVVPVISVPSAGYIHADEVNSKE